MKIYTNNTKGFEQHIGFKEPNYIWYGILTLILMLSAHHNPNLDLILMINIFSTLFVLDGLINIYKKDLGEVEK